MVGTMTLPERVLLSYEACGRVCDVCDGGDDSADCSCLDGPTMAEMATALRATLATMAETEEALRAALEELRNRT